MWTGEFDLNTLRVGGEIFESGKKKLRIQKYPDKLLVFGHCSLIKNIKQTAVRNILKTCIL